MPGTLPARPRAGREAREWSCRRLSLCSARKCGAHADGREDAVFFSVHRREARLIMIIESSAMQQTMDAVQQQLALDGMSQFRSPPRSLVGAYGDIRLDCIGAEIAAVGSIE